MACVGCRLGRQAHGVRLICLMCLVRSAGIVRSALPMLFTEVGSRGYDVDGQAGVG